MMKDKKQLGLTIVELMVALALSAVLATALYRIYIGNQHGMMLTDSYAKTQDAARTTFDLLQYDLRMAQYLGCLGSKNAMNILPSGNSDYKTQRTVTTEIPSVYLNMIANEIDIDIDSTMLLLRKVIGLDAVVQRDFVQDFKVIGPIQQLEHLKPNDLVMLTDCEQGDVFEIEEVEVTYDSGDGTYYMEISPKDPLSRSYKSGSRLHLLHTIIYFVGKSRLIDHEGVNSLYMLDSFDSDPVTGLPKIKELVPYVNRMLLNFLVEDEDTGISEYINAIAEVDGDDAAIHAVRVNLRLKTEKSCDTTADSAADFENCFRAEEYERAIYFRNRGKKGG